MVILNTSIAIGNATVKNQENLSLDPKKVLVRKKLAWIRTWK